MLSTILEYINNIYILPILATIIGLTIVYLYDLFEKKQYNNAVYFRIGILLYISCLATIYISRLPIIESSRQSSGQSGGSNTLNVDSQSFMPKPNDLYSNHEHFKTGVPTF